MRYYHYSIYMLLALAIPMLLQSCGKDYKDDIDDLNNKFTSIDQRVSKIETQVSTMNTQLAQLSVLTEAVEQGFYVKEVKTTSDGYELTLSNGRVLTFQRTPDNTLVMTPAVSMAQIGGLYFWTMNGTLITDASGNPVRAAANSPIVKYDYTLQQWVISIDGGKTFLDINVNTSIVINDTILLQVINNYLRQSSTTIISEEVLYQIISTYIQQNYAQLFNIKILDEVVVNHVNKYYSRIFSYELMEKIFTQYNFSYIKSQIKVNELVNVIVNFIKEHQEIFLNNEVLYEIVTNYIELNKTTIFSNELLLEVINNFVQNNKNYIDIALLTRVVNNYIEVNQNVIFNTETIKNIMMEYVRKYYTQIFAQDILIRVLNTYVVKNSNTIFNKTIITEVVNNYIKNNYTTIFSQETIVEIVNTYIKKNSTTVINREVLIEVITNYFEKNYNLFIDKTVISTAVNNYLTVHKTTIIDVNIIREIVNSYVKQYYLEIFSVDMLSKVVKNYFETNMQVVTQYITEGSDIIKSINASDDRFTITLRDGKGISLVVYDAFARLKSRVQNIVPVPNEDGHFKEQEGSNIGFLYLRYLVAPASMANIIRTRFYSKEIDMELMVTDSNGNLSSLPVYEPVATGDGILQVNAMTQTYGAVKSVALHVKDTKTGGTDIMTEFVPVDSEKQVHTYKTCPDSNHPHMIDLGLPSGTLWACCNVEASKPEDMGGYYAWGETQTKASYTFSTYKHRTVNSATSSYISIGNNISGTQYDVAYVKWGSSWCMPTEEQFKELVDKTNSVWTSQNGVSGRKFSSSNGGSIFIPASGNFTGDKNYSQGFMGFYWASTLYQIQGNYTQNLTSIMYFSAQIAAVGGSDSGTREYGNSVRPVVNSK